MDPFREPGERPVYVDPPPPPPKPRPNVPVGLVMWLFKLRDFLSETTTKRALVGVAIVVVLALALPFTCGAGHPRVRSLP